jgi:molybdopterin-synthase adenylyltransferase
MTTIPASLPRNIRQAEIVPQDELERVAVVLVGCGAIGSWLGQFLAHLGVTWFLGVDPDHVTTENLGLQGYTRLHLHVAKVVALRQIVEEINPTAQFYGRCETFKRDMLKAIPPMYTHVVVFSCVDDIEVRAFLYKAVRDRCSLFIDGRMAALTWRVITIDRWPDYYYEATLFPASEALELRCTAKGTVFTAADPANKMGQQLMLWLKGGRVGDGNLARDIEYNILATSQELRDAVAEAEPDA